MTIKERLKLLYLETNYLLDTYNDNLRNENEHENKKILEDLEQLRQERIGIMFEVHELLKPSMESIAKATKRNNKDLTDREINPLVKEARQRWRDAVIANLMGEY